MFVFSAHTVPSLGVRTKYSVPIPPYRAHTRIPCPYPDIVPSLGVRTKPRGPCQCSPRFVFSPVFRAHPRASRQSQGQCPALGTVPSSGSVLNPDGSAQLRGLCTTSGSVLSPEARTQHRGPYLALGPYQVRARAYPRGPCPTPPFVLNPGVHVQPQGQYPARGLYPAPRSCPVPGSMPTCGPSSASGSPPR